MAQIAPAPAESPEELESQSRTAALQATTPPPLSTWYDRQAQGGAASSGMPQLPPRSPWIDGALQMHAHRAGVEDLQQGVPPPDVLFGESAPHLQQDGGLEEPERMKIGERSARHERSPPVPPEPDKLGAIGEEDEESLELTRPSPASSRPSSRPSLLSKRKRRALKMCPDALWSFFGDWFGTDQFNIRTPLRYLDMDGAETKELGKTGGKNHMDLITQHFPAFTLIQTTAAFGLWLVFSFGERDTSIPWTLTKAGLDSIAPGRFDLRLGLECKDSRFEIWRWFSYQYTHAGLAHVMMNSALNLMLGTSIEGFHGTWRTILMYNVGVFGGACCYFVFDVHHAAVGMSGGCYSFIGMHLGCTLMNWHQKKYRWMKLFFLALLAVADILNAQIAVSNGDVAVSHSIHFGGYVAGVLICVVIGRNLVVKRWERVMWFAAIGIGLLLAVFSLSWGMTWPPQTIGEQARWCWTRQVNNVRIFGNNQWHCVRCGSQGCIDKWSQEKHIATVSTRSCDKRGGWRVTED